MKQYYFSPSSHHSVSSEANNKALYYVIPKSTSNHPKTAMFLNGKEAKTVLLSTLSTTSTASQPPIVVLANGQNNSGHPNPMQLLPVLSSAVTSVAAAKPNEIKSVAAVTSTRNGETNNNNKVIYPWHSLVPFLGNILLVTNLSRKKLSTLDFFRSALSDH